MSPFSGLKPRFWDHRDVAADLESGHFSYRHKWLIIVAFTTVVSLTPLLVMTLMDYRLSRKAFENEAEMAVSHMASRAGSTLSFVLAQRRMALEFVLRDNSLHELLASGRLEEILAGLQMGMEGFMNISVIGADAVIKAYAGPQPQPARWPAIRACYEQAVADGIFISDIRPTQGSGHYLSFWIRQNMADGNFFLLRATLDADLLERYLLQIPVKSGDDAFLINSAGILQTPSRQHGQRYDPLPQPLSGNGYKPRAVESVDKSGKPILVGIAPVIDSPFMVMMVRQASGIMDLWFKPRLRLIGFLIFSVVLILVSILGVATYLVNRIYTANQHRIQALHQVEYTNKLASLGRLASGVAHEVNNPLAIINQKAGLIRDLFTLNPTYAGDEKITRLIDDVLKSVQRGGTITRRLLDFARHLESDIEPVDIEAIIRQVLAFMEKDAARRCIAINISVADNIPIFDSDRGNLQQIFLNLINNAFAAMADGGRLEITVDRPTPQQIRVRVSDTGHGIPEADLKQVFEPFFTTRHGQAGTGLGLSITYGMVTEMGGEISVKSKVNQGTCFSLILPFALPTPSSAKSCRIETDGQSAENDVKT